MPMRARCEGNWSPQTSQFSVSFGNRDDLADVEVMGAHSSSHSVAGNDGLPNHSTRQREATVRAGMVENRSAELSVGMLFPRQQRKYAELTRGGTMQGQSCHKEHSMFRVSAPPKPQTPGPSRPAPLAPHERRPG